MQKQTKYSNLLSEEVLHFNYRQYSAADRLTLRTFFDTYKGRYGLFWVPSWKSDYILASSISVGAGQMEVRAAQRPVTFLGYTRHLYFPDIPFCAKITAIAGSLGEEYIAFTPALSGGNIAAGAEVYNLFFCRFDVDALRIQAVEGGTDTEATLEFRELQMETL